MNIRTISRAYSNQSLMASGIKASVLQSLPHYKYSFLFSPSRITNNCLTVIGLQQVRHAVQAAYIIQALDETKDLLLNKFQLYPTTVSTLRNYLLNIKDPLCRINPDFRNMEPQLFTEWLHFILVTFCFP